MKKLALFICSLLAGASAIAQVTSLNETFDVTCAVSGLNYPAGWSEYHIAKTDDLLSWNCGTTFGISGTGCQQINGYYGTTNHLDSAWLITPQLDLSSYTGSIYLQFQSKFRFPGDKLSLFISHNYHGGYPDSSAYTWTNVMSSLAPAFGVFDSTDWTTHTVDLTSFKSSPLYFAFRYTSSATASARWDIENVKTTDLSAAAVAVTQAEKQEVSVIGATDRITVSLTNPAVGNCALTIYDVLGRKYYQEDVQLKTGRQQIVINGLSLKKGLYIIRLAGTDPYSFVQTLKTVIE